jgi:hypothetical protein
MKRKIVVNCILVFAAFVEYIAIIFEVKVPIFIEVYSGLSIVAIFIWNNYKAQVLEAEKDSYRIIEFIGKFIIEQYIGWNGKGFNE